MKLIVLLAVVPFVLTAHPIPCCISTKFTATLLQFGGYVDPITHAPKPTNAISTIHYDYDDKWMRTDQDVPQSDGSINRITIINDFKAKKTYTLTGGVCTVTNRTDEMTPNCVPVNSTFIGTSKIGPVSRSFSVNTWAVRLSQTYAIKISLTADHCIPFSESVYGTVNGVTSVIHYMFMDFKHSIQDRIFEIPDSCHVTVLGQVIGRSILKSRFLP